MNTTNNNHARLAEKRIEQIEREIAALVSEAGQLRSNLATMGKLPSSSAIQAWIDKLDELTVWKTAVIENREDYAFNKYSVPFLISQTKAFKTKSEKLDFWSNLGHYRAVRIFLGRLIDGLGLENPYWPRDLASRFYDLACYELDHPGMGHGYPKPPSQQVDPEILTARDYLWKAIFTLAEI